MASTVLVHANRADRQASNFLAAPDRAFAASLCYAKITPAPLQHGEFTSHCRKDAEAAGRKRKFQSRDFWRVLAGSTMPGRGAARMASS
jgi:hypothetical protein